MTYALHPGAEDELTEAALYYAEHAKMVRDVLRNLGQPVVAAAAVAA